MTHDTQYASAPHMTLPNGDIIREGDYAVTRDGLRVGPMVFGHDGTYAKTHPWRDNKYGRTFTCNGSWDEQSKTCNDDLVAKWHPVGPGPDPVTPDYNNGELHAWNGGECPVHPKSAVDVMLRDGSKPGVRFGWSWDWRHDKNSSDITSFRVVTPYVEPATEPFTPPAKRRKWWIVENRVFDSARQAKIAYPGSAPIKVKECKK